LNVNGAIRKAEKLEQSGCMIDAVALYREILNTYPANQRARRAASQAIKKVQSVLDPPASAQRVVAQALADGKAAAVLQHIAILLPEYPKSQFLLSAKGRAEHQLGQIEQALLTLQHALQLDPCSVETHVALGDIYKACQAFEAAAKHFRLALDNAPGHLVALNNLGNTYLALQDHTAALDCFRRAYKRSPRNAEVLYNLAMCHFQSEDHQAAMSLLKRAVALSPDFVSAHYNLGLLHRLRGALKEAVCCFERVLTIDPAHGPAWGEMLHQKAMMCDWTWVDQLGVLKSMPLRKPAAPYPFLAMEDDPAEQRARSETYAKAQGFVKPDRLPAKPRRDGKLRIGYFSADFHDHATMHLFGGVCENHDLSRFHVSLYSYGPHSRDAVRRRVEQNANSFQDIRNLTDGQAAARARADGLDVAIDLKGYTGDHRVGIFSHRAAPVQISYLGYPGTCGGPFDYVLADSVVLPKAYEHGFTEDVLRLPNTYQPNDDIRPTKRAPVSRGQANLPETGFVFCCFNNSFKLTPTEFDVWCRLLRANEGSVLWLMETNDWAKDNLRSAAKLRRVDPDRLIFAPRLDRTDHLARMPLADLFLDTFAYNAHTTASDALWAGVPVVTLAGRQFSARVGASLLTAAMLPELITHDVDAYQALISDLVRNPTKLRYLRQRLRDNQACAPMFDTGRFVLDLEALLMDVAAKHGLITSPQRSILA
jgi:predicted O-linked N-acetylglucosamine transferase (SPINDLY family)